MGNYCWWTGQPERALAYAVRAEEAFDRLGDDTRFVCRFSVGQAYHALGDYRRAIKPLTDTVVFFSEDRLRWRPTGTEGLARFSAVRGSLGVSASLARPRPRRPASKTWWRSRSGSATRSASSTPSGERGRLSSASDMPTPPSPRWSGRSMSADKRVLPSGCPGWWRHWAAPMPYPGVQKRASRFWKRAFDKRRPPGSCSARHCVWPGWPRCTRAPAAWQRRTTRPAERSS